MSNPIVIVVKSENTILQKTKNGTQLRKQQAALDIGGDYPLPFYMTVNEPYKPGRYTLSPASFRVNGFQSLELNRFEMELVPLA